MTDQERPPYEAPSVEEVEMDGDTAVTAPITTGPA